MSHVVEIRTEVRDPLALASACQRLGLPEPARETVKLFSAEAAGHAVRLPGWRYPVVCDTAAGRLSYDDYEGRWGERKHLDALLQAYAVEKAKLEARKNGHSVTERLLADGSVRLTVHLGGAA